MGRWEPGARERMIGAALELFGERGFEATTAADIAERAGVTERTFFRHFADKREVLFDGGDRLQSRVDTAIASAPAAATALEAAVEGMAATGEFFDEIREHARRRATIIAANPGLQERELLKLAAMTDATAAALRARGVGEPTATLAAHSAVTIFHVAFARWLEPDGPAFASCVAAAADALRSAVA